MPRPTRRGRLRLESLEVRCVPASPLTAPSLGPPPTPGPDVVWVDTVAELESAAEQARRRRILSTLVFIPSLIASNFMLDVLPQKGGSVMEWLIVIFFGALFGWISIGFWTALYGFFTVVRKVGRF